MTEAEDKLKKKILKGIPEPLSLVGKLLRRREFSYVVVKYLHKTRLTPNPITYLELLLLLFSGFLIATGNHVLIAIGGVIFLVCTYLDYVDGDLARAKSMCTKLGCMLDALAFYISQIVSIFGPLIAIYRTTGSSRVLILGGFTAVCAAVYLVLSAFAESGQFCTGGKSTTSASNVPEQAVKMIQKGLRRKIRQIFRIDIDSTDLFGTDARLLVLVLGCLSGKLSWALVYFLISFAYLLVFELYPRYARLRISRG